MKSKILLLFVFLTFEISRAGIEGVVTPHTGTKDTIVILKYEANISNFNGIGKLKICLNRYDFVNLRYPACDWPSYYCETMLYYGDIIIENGYSKGYLEFNLTDFEPWLYRFFIELNTTYKSYDCDKDNTFFLQGKEIIRIDKGIKVKAEIPDEVFAGEDFYIHVNITNEGEEKNLKVYSYAYKNLTCISSGGWLGNLKEIFLSNLSSVSFNLKNKILENYSGVYKFKVRVRYDNKKYDISKDILVKKKRKFDIKIKKFEFNCSSEEYKLKISNFGNEISKIKIILIGNKIFEKNFSIAPYFTKEFYFHENLSEKNFNSYLFIFLNNTLIERSKIKIDCPETNSNSSNEIITSNFLKVNSYSNEIGDEISLLYILLILIALIGIFTILKKSF